MLEGVELAKTAAALARSKKAEDIVILDLRDISTITDFFVICAAGSQPHIRAIRKEVRDNLKEEHGVSPQSVEGQGESQWMILDYGDVIVHIFHPERREYFSLEDLWGDAPRIEVADAEPSRVGGSKA